MIKIQVKVWNLKEVIWTPSKILKRWTSEKGAKIIPSLCVDMDQVIRKTQIWIHKRVFKQRKIREYHQFDFQIQQNNSNH